MRIIKANQFSEREIREFFKNTDQIKLKTILQSGYMLEVNDKIRGCFVLEEMAEKVYELKKFYLVSTEAIKIPTLFEAVLSIAKEKGAKQVFVNSQKLMTDIVLKSLNFYPQADPVAGDKRAEKGGKWWSYTIPD